MSLRVFWLKATGRGQPMREWPKLLVAGPRWLATTLLVATLLLTIFLIVAFWPGSIGHDFHITLLEAASWKFEGHQPPTAAIATSILTAGTASFTAIFVIKVLAHLGGLAAIVADWRAPALVKVGAFTLFLSPIMFALTPLLRNSTLELTFVTLAIALGLTGRTRWHALCALVSLIMATMYAPVIHFGHVALVVMHVLWKNPDLSFLRAARQSLTPIVLVLAPAAVANLATGNIDRGSSIYVSALNSLGGMHVPGETTCIPGSVVRGSSSPAEIFETDYRFGQIVINIWGNESRGFKKPDEVSPKDRIAVRDCWISTALSNPPRFVAERLRMAVYTIGGSRFEPNFVWIKSGEDYLLHPQFLSSIPWAERDMPALAKIVDRYGRFGEAAKFGSAVPYLGLYFLTILIACRIRPDLWRFVLVSGVAVLGFMAPQLMFAQDALFRYYSVASMIASLVVLACVWRVLEGPASALGRLGLSRQGKSASEDPTSA
jgi:hypothetical protein